MYTPVANFVHGEPVAVDFRPQVPTPAGTVVITNGRVGITHINAQANELIAQAVGPAVYDILSDGSLFADRQDVYWLVQNAQTVTSITQTTGTATVTTPVAHGLVVGQLVTIAGANQAGYNGTYPIVAVGTTTTFTYAVPSATVTPATGTITSTPSTGGLATATSAGNAYMGYSLGGAASVAGQSSVRVFVPTVGRALGVSGMTTVAATGSTQANGAALNLGYNFVTGADATKGVVLPPGVPAGSTVEVKNADAANAILKVYPNTTGGTVNALSAGAAISMAAKTACTFKCNGSDVWITIPLVPS